MAYDAKNSPQLGRQLEVQRLVIPVLLTGNATAASVSLMSDEPEFVLFNSSSVNQISAALAPNETATYSAAPSDSAGVVQCLVQIGEPLVKICKVSLVNRQGVNTGDYAYLGSATGITILTTPTGPINGSNMMVLLNVANVLSSGSSVNDCCLEVDYIVTQY
jgi:hypothetical protein